MNAKRKIPKNPKTFTCINCDYNTSSNKDYIKHMATDKHKNAKDAKENPEKSPILYICCCGKNYKHQSSLCRHQQTCNIYKKGIEFTLINKTQENQDDKCSEKEVSILKEMFLEMVSQNKTLQATIFEQNKLFQNTITDLIPKIGSNNTVNNTNTNNIVINNLTLLNTNCKDAMSLTNFIESIEVGIKDLVYTSEKGLANGVTNLFLEHYNKLPIELRPVWCGDRKRTKLYIKEETEWEEDIDNLKTRAAIVSLTSKQARSSGKYTKENPDWMQHDDKKDQFVHIVRNTTQDMDAIKQTHIIRNLLDTIHLTESIKTELKTS